MFLLPDTNIWLLKPVSQLYYYDEQRTQMPHDMTALEAWNCLMRTPVPFLQTAFRVRDAISALFGVKKIGGFSGGSAQNVQVGTHLDFFLVEHIEDSCLVLTARDRHLDVMTCISTDTGELLVTSSVCVHNWFGRVYMLPVGVAHRWIVRAMFKRLSRG